jgi:transposase
MKKPVLIGIDVSALTFSMAEAIPDQEVREGEGENTPAGHRELCRRLAKARRPVRVCLEASGIYHLDLTLALAATPNVEVMVANPRASRDFARAQMGRSKTDRTDARSLLEFVRRMPFVAWVAPSPQTLALRAIARRIAALSVHSAQERSRRDAADHCAALPDVLDHETDAHLAFLKESSKRLAAEAVKIIDADPWLPKAFGHLVSVRGIAQTSAIALLGELAILPTDMSARQWVAHAGIDPRHFKSGTSVDKPPRISKTGNRRIRAALYMPALVAIQSEPNVRAFYEKLLARGKKPLQAIVAVMRKLLHAIWGMLHHDCDFEGEKFYRLPA